MLRYRLTTGKECSIFYIHSRKKVLNAHITFLARLYESTGRAIAVTPATALASALVGVSVGVGVAQNVKVLG